jgi:Na+/melibiose symporter-like transporter
VLVSLGYSMASIAYAVWGAEVAPTPALRTRVVASREGFALVGVLLAAVLPGVLAGGAGEAAGLAALPWVFIPLLIGAPPGPWGWRRGRRPARRRPPLAGQPAGGAAGRRLRRLLGVFAVNGIAAAVPSATVLFFVADVLRAAELAGLFLALYFLAAACSLPCGWPPPRASASCAPGWPAWAGAGGVRLGRPAGGRRHLGLRADLRAVGLRAGGRPGAAAVAAGRSAGPARRPQAPRASGAAFGWWNFVTKANLALAAGLALPLLALLGYSPGSREAGAVRRWPRCMPSCPSC